ncbi:MAG: class I SAM-dependent methyltransferase [Ignavibacteriales bacterium]|nr:class I SAM-dependent methyltransferase [Ignavibacteriales bacterium]
MLLCNTDYRNPDSFGSRMRAKRVRIFLDMAEDVFKQNGSVKVVDIGGTPEYWGIVGKETITRLNMHITIINVDKTMRGLQPCMTYVQGDACEMYMFADKSFQLAHSNSVIEHVGSDENKKRFAKEVQRVAEHYYIQTPNFYFPIEPHFLIPFFHWMPYWMRIQLSMLFNMGYYERAESRQEAEVLLKHNAMLSKKEFRKLFPLAKIITEKFLGLSKSFIAIG